MKKIVVAFLMITIVFSGCANGIETGSAKQESTLEQADIGRESIDPSTNTEDQRTGDISFFEEKEESGFIDPDGNKVVLSNKYDDFGDEFYNNRLVVFNHVEEGKYVNPYPVFDLAVLDEYGNIIVDFGLYISDSKNIHYENSGLIISTTSGNRGVIDIDGNYIIEPIYRSISPEFVANRRAVSIKEGHSIKSGYFDENYNIAIPLEYNIAYGFVEANEEAYAIVLKTNMALYPVNALELPEDHLFSYSIIDIDGNIVYEEPDLIYCDFDTYQLFRANSLNMTARAEQKEYFYIVFDKTTMEKKTINLNEFWTNNYDASVYVEDPQWLQQIEGMDEIGVYVWDENTKYEVHPVDELLK